MKWEGSSRRSKLSKEFGTELAVALTADADPTKQSSTEGGVREGTSKSNDSLQQTVISHASDKEILMCSGNAQVWP